ncbi:hypothetical protein [Streptomyces sp. NPDC097981]|uniref:hypothetical protein n=1 Tax=Streptomyces sp. NPDC097981 TaxID=3155428 RepID=UPI0033275D09
MAGTRLAEWSQRDRAEAAGRLMPGWVALLWLVEGVDLATGHALDAYGITARTADGLTGIPLAPFHRFGFGHVASNSVPLPVLGFVERRPPGVPAGIAAAFLFPRRTPQGR